MREVWLAGQGSWSQGSHLSLQVGGSSALSLSFLDFGLGLVDHDQNFSNSVVERGRDGVANIGAFVQRLRQGPILHHGYAAIPRYFLDLLRQQIQPLGHHRSEEHTS